MIFDVEDSGYWVVRADKNTLHKSFIHGSFVAIKHFDSFNIFGDIKKYNGPIEKFVNGDSESSIRSKAVQVDTFINRINPGDMAITVGDGKISFGVFEGPSFFSNEPIYYDGEIDNENIIEGFFLRRKVKWGPTIDRYTVSKNLIKALFAHQAVFSLDSYWKDICQRIFPVFKHKDNIFITLAIGSEKPIDAIDIASLINYLIDVEMIAKSVELTADNRRESSTKLRADFNSPGFLFAEQILDNANTYYAIIGYAMLFGNKHLGMDGIITKNSREKIVEFIIDRFKHHDIAHHLSKPDAKKPVDENDLTVFKDSKINKSKDDN